jgi:aspartate carbamoyltransferase catalytic subunit
VTWISASLMDKPNSCVVANTQTKPGISRQVRAMRKLEYARAISLSRRGGPNCRESSSVNACLNGGSGGGDHPSQCSQAVFETIRVLQIGRWSKLTIFRQ